MKGNREPRTQNSEPVTIGGVTERPSAPPTASRQEEAYRALRTALLLPAEGPPPRKITVAHAGPGRAGVRVAAGLALSIARSGARVIALECDLRRSQLHEALGLPNGNGLAACLRDGSTPALQAGPQGLLFLSAGTAASDAPELLGGARFPSLLVDLLEQADHLVLNTPPLSEVADAALVAAGSDAVLLTVEAGHTGRDAGMHAVAVLRRANAPLAGAVLVEPR